MNQPTTQNQHNLPEYSVSEIASAIKQQVEDRFGYVRVRGEISGYKLATSGHAYFKLKDDNAVLEAVSWRGSLTKMVFKPEDGLEVMAYGRITTYPGRSSYQIVVDRMEPAGVGALMALLEERKKKLASEGLFDESHKRVLPFLPQTIGVVTSPTGAVIQDILHRLAERFPCHVVVWPVAVQGEAAAAQIAAAIDGFNCWREQTGQRPVDVIIVARGGGSIEDLWAFNEEIVVRAAWASRIPLISAVGHETDTTLIDFVADRRAPTPTAAAEIAVPVKLDLALLVESVGLRLRRHMHVMLEQQRLRLSALARGMVNPVHLLELKQQRLDMAASRLQQALPSWLEKQQQLLHSLHARLSPGVILKDVRHQQKRLDAVGERLMLALPKALLSQEEKLRQLASRLQASNILRDIQQHHRQLEQQGLRLQRGMFHRLERSEQQLTQYGRLLKAASYESALERGFAVVTNLQGELIRTAGEARQQENLRLQFVDGITNVRRQE